MPKSLFTAGLGAGKASGKYQASLYDITNQYGEIEFAGKKAALDIKNLTSKVSTAASFLEIGSTLAGGYEDRKELEGEYLPALEESRFKKEYKGKLSFEEFKAQKPEEYTQKFESYKVERSIWDRLKGDKQMYQFGFDDDAKQFSKTDLTAAGKYAKGVSDWESLGLDTDYFGFKSKKPQDIQMFEEVNVTGSDYKSTSSWNIMGKEDRSKFSKLYPEGTEADLFSFIKKYGYSQ
jgi:hypothetical protein